MDIRKLILENILYFNTWYDVASFCYDILIDTVGDQELFIGEYILYNNRAENKNPNLEKLRVFESKSKTIIINNNFDLENGINDIIKLIANTLSILQPYGNNILNQATLLYFLLSAIDRYAAGIRNIKYMPGPLNHVYKRKSYVYFASPKSLIYDAAVALEFRNVITDTKIKHCLTNLCVLEASECEGHEPPKVVAISFDIESEIPFILQEDEYHEYKNSTLKVALIPFWGKIETDFHVTSGAKFKVRYSEKYIDFAKKRAVELLELAIDNKANIIVFPEYICAPPIQLKISEYLSQLYRQEPNRLKETILIIAGSGWTDDNNNVMQIYDRCGAKVGTYYKYTKFYKDDYMEDLSEPGKECTIIDVLGLGRILPSICRDVSYEDYTEKLVNIFNPFLLFTSAWSPSIRGGFKNQYDALAKRYQVTSMLCNCCEAICPRSEKDNVEKTVNLIAVPFKDYSICNTDFVELKRTENCYKNCEEYKCMFIISADFSKECVEKRQVILPKSANVNL